MAPRHATLGLEELRERVVGQAFFDADLAGALRRLGFVQADPIRAPARAQDLILRQRVPGYRAGQLEARYVELGVAEERLHVYGFVPRAVRALLHPRRRDRVWRIDAEHPRLRPAVLKHLRDHGATHPRALSQALGAVSTRNDWGGASAATTRMLEALHHEGRLVVVRREDGIRVYDLAPRDAASLPKRSRGLGILRLFVSLYGPLPLASLRILINLLGDRAPRGLDMRDLLRQALASDLLACAPCAGVDYVFLPEMLGAPLPDPERVRLLAPFDPLVWDRRRFEHLWGWSYRFEAYTPAPRRRFGYYALPILWRAEVIGWANLKQIDGALDAQFGYVKSRPRAPVYRRLLDEEVARIEAFLAAPACAADCASGGEFADESAKLPAFVRAPAR